MMRGCLEASSNLGTQDVKSMSSFGESYQGRISKLDLDKKG